MTITATEHRVTGDPVDYGAHALDRGWGDGLPMIPPTPTAALR